MRNRLSALSNQWYLFILVLTDLAFLVWTALMPDFNNFQLIVSLQSIHPTETSMSRHSVCNSIIKRIRCRRFSKSNSWPTPFRLLIFDSPKNREFHGIHEAWISDASARMPLFFSKFADGQKFRLFKKKRRATNHSDSSWKAVPPIKESFLILQTVIFVTVDFVFADIVLSTKKNIFGLRERKMFFKSWIEREQIF